METVSQHRLRIKILYESIVSRGFLALFIGAFLLGAGIKVLVRDVVTIGYDDYTLPRQDTPTDLNVLEKELIKNKAPQREPVPKGETCTQEV